MGTVSSQLKPRVMQRLMSTSSVDSQNGETLDIPDDILIHVLSFVSAQDLLRSCCLVCRQWNSLISGHIIWKRKCQYEGKVIPKYIFKNIPKNFYRKIYLNNPYGRNLLKNPDGAEGTAHWEVQTSGFLRDENGGWAIEMPPVGADPVPDEAGTEHCYATTYELCEKSQTIDLVKEGINEEILDEVHPSIAVGEWHAARFDCGSIYNLKVALLDASHSEVSVFKFGPYKEEQFVGRAWSKAEHVFSDYPPGVRYVVFSHSGVDTQWWAGHYGSKMTGGYVRFTWKEQS